MRTYEYFFKHYFFSIPAAQLLHRKIHNVTVWIKKLRVSVKTLPLSLGPVPPVRPRSLYLPEELANKIVKGGRPGLSNSITG